MIKEIVKASREGELSNASVARTVGLWYKHSVRMLTE